MESSFEEQFSKTKAMVVPYESWVENSLYPFVVKMAQMKSSEYHHQIDGYNEEKRIMTGLLGELAVERLLGVKVVNWNIGLSQMFNLPDVSGYNVGVKTVEYGKFPVIPIDNKYPQIICVVNKTEHKVYILGYATIDMLNTYQDDKLILSYNLRARKTKTCFNRLDLLHSLHSLSDLEDYKQ